MGRAIVNNQKNNPGKVAVVAPMRMKKGGSVGTGGMAPPNKLKTAKFVNQ